MCVYIYTYMLMNKYSNIINKIKHLVKMTKTNTDDPNCGIHISMFKKQLIKNIYNLQI